MPDKRDLISSLKEVVQYLHKCQAVFYETVPVDEKFDGRTVWKGDVEIFTLVGHPRARRCFAWLHDDGKSTRYVALLESLAIASPEMAVRAMIAFRPPQYDNGYLTNRDL
jgi:hypothetical protein